MNNIVFKRQHLFDQVWNTPISTLAIEYNINVYQLTKACNKLNIPRPESGYWSKVRNGKKVNPRPKLPDHDIEEYELILNSEPNIDLNMALPKSFKEFSVRKNLRTLHPLVKKTYDYIIEQKRGDNHGRFRPYQSGYLGLLVTKENLKRACLIMDALLKELERQEFKIGTEASQKIVFTTVKNDTDVIYLRLEEEGSINRTKSDSKWRKFDYDHYTTGKLRLRISAYRYTDWGLKVSDTNSKLIEEQSRRIFISIVETFEKAKERRLEFEERNRRYEKERIDRERIRKEEEAEQKKRNELEAAAESFTKSEYIYQFIDEIEIQKLKLELSQEDESKFNEWISWAKDHADRLNPVKQQFDSIFSKYHTSK